MLPSASNRVFLTGGRAGKDPLNRGLIRRAQRRHRRPIDDEMRRSLEALGYISP